MKVADVNCKQVGGLLSRWLDGALTAVDVEAYEQHINVCPPCRRQNDKLQDGLAALRAAADAAPAPALLDELSRVTPETGVGQ